MKVLAIHVLVLVVGIAAITERQDIIFTDVGFIGGQTGTAHIATVLDLNPLVRLAQDVVEFLFNGVVNCTLKEVVPPPAQFRPGHVLYKSPCPIARGGEIHVQYEQHIEQFLFAQRTITGIMSAESKIDDRHKRAFSDLLGGFFSFAGSALVGWMDNRKFKRVHEELDNVRENVHDLVEVVELQDAAISHNSEQFLRLRHNLIELTNFQHGLHLWEQQQITTNALLGDYLNTVNRVQVGSFTCFLSFFKFPFNSCSVRSTTP